MKSNKLIGNGIDFIGSDNLSVVERIVENKVAKYLVNLGGDEDILDLNLWNGEAKEEIAQDERSHLFNTLHLSTLPGTIYCIGDYEVPDRVFNTRENEEIKLKKSSTQYLICSRNIVGLKMKSNAAGELLGKIYMKSSEGLGNIEIVFLTNSASFTRWLTVIDK